MCTYYASNGEAGHDMMYLAKRTRFPGGRHPDQEITKRSQFSGRGSTALRTLKSQNEANLVRRAPAGR
jgi:hypothetical protein